MTHPNPHTIRIVTSDNRHLFEDCLEDMFKMRARAAIEEMGWNIPIDDNKRDIDQFDYPDTIYILHYNTDGTIGGCARLNPTTRPHLISDIFASMCFSEVPSAPDIYTYSRYLIERQGKSQKEYMNSWILIGQAVNEYCVEHGIKQVTWLARKRLYQMAAGVWKTRPLGPPRFFKDDQKTYVAGISDMTKEGLPKVHRYSKYTDTLLHYDQPNLRTKVCRRLKI